MLNGYVIGAEKLSRQQFSDKYWLRGDAEYQFHTMSIEDGLDERQQLLINNDRALFKSIDWHYQRTREMVANAEKEIAQKSKATRRAIATLMAINTAIVVTLIKIWREPVVRL